MKQKAKALAVKHAVRIERTRVAAEAIGCAFVAVETHFIVFSVICIGWAAADIAKLIELGVREGQAAIEALEGGE